MTNILIMLLVMVMVTYDIREWVGKTDDNDDEDKINNQDDAGDVYEI